jgi:hypothetical protein
MSVQQSGENSLNQKSKSEEQTVRLPPAEQCPKCQKFFSDSENDQALTLKCKHFFCRKCLVAIKRDCEIMCPLDFKTTPCKYVADLMIDMDSIRLAIARNGQNMRSNDMVQEINYSLIQTIDDPFLVPVNLDFLNPSNLNLDRMNFKCLQLKIEDTIKGVFVLEPTIESSRKLSDKTIKVVDLFTEENIITGMENWKFEPKSLTVEGITYQVLGFADVYSIPQNPPTLKVKVLPSHFKLIGSIDSTTLANAKFAWTNVNLDKEIGKILIVV